MSTTGSEGSSKPRRPKSTSPRRGESRCSDRSPRPRSSPNVTYYQLRLPRKNQGAHLRLHRSLTPRLRRADTQVPHDAYGPCMNILHKQRAATRNFASQLPFTARYVRNISERLYTGYDARFKPAESRGREPVNVEYYTLTQKPLYTAAEVKSIVDLLTKGSKDENGNDGPPPRIPSRKGYYPADLVCEIIKENIVPDTKGTKARPRSCKSRIIAPVLGEIARDVKSCEKRGNADETTKRISQYDSRTWPPESKGHKTRTPPPPAEQQESGSKKMREEEVDHVVERLNKYDKRTWPPESKGTK